MKFTLTDPCGECPFLNRNAKSYGRRRLREMTLGAFHCHKTGTVAEDDELGTSEFVPTENSLYCAGALIFMEKRGQSNQIMRIAERLRLYDRTKLNMKAPVA